jgi:hypothetical protein
MGGIVETMPSAHGLASTTQPGAGPSAWFRGATMFATLFLCLVGSAWATGGSPKGTGQATLLTLPPGSVLYLRLESAVSTTGSHLREPITARVVREVAVPSGGQGVAIPLGAVVSGQIEKLIPSSNPTDRASLRLRFSQLEIPGRPPIALAGHVTEVENARETVLGDGTVQGLLANELPVTVLEKALDRLQKSDPNLGAEARKTKEQALGKGDTSIDFPAGTDLHFVLDKPIAVDQVLPYAVSDTLAPEVSASIENLLAALPQRAESKDGKPGDPVNLVLIGNAEEVRRAFLAAGWSEPEKLTGKSLWETIRAVAANQGYGTAPVSQLYLFGRPEDLAFQKTLNTFAERHHLRLWRTSATTSSGREIWVGAATHDVGWDVRPGEGVASHAIDPEIDKERSKVGADLVAGGDVAALRLTVRPNPLSEGLTATGASWRTDGRLLVVQLKAQ